MWVAPPARMEDGYFELVVMGDVSKIEVLTNITRLYRGDFCRVPQGQGLSGPDH